MFQSMIWKHCPWNEKFILYWSRIYYVSELNIIHGDFRGKSNMNKLWLIQGLQCPRKWVKVAEIEIKVHWPLVTFCRPFIQKRINADNYLDFSRASIKYYFVHKEGRTEAWNSACGWNKSFNLIRCKVIIGKYWWIRLMMLSLLFKFEIWKSWKWSYEEISS